MDQRVEKVNRELKWWTWKRVLVATVVVLAILEVGTYAFNWTWTGFKSNDTVWDYLQLLLLPIALAAVPIWFAAEEEQQRLWLTQLKWMVVAIVAVFVVLFIGSYIYNWSWTGFHDHGRLWDRLSLLLVPMIVAVLPIWFSIQQSHGSNETSKQQHQQDA